ncbi:hypothetical protein OAU93_00080 [bacterium]|nr:hypothetical protein [bacterium]
MSQSNVEILEDADLASVGERGASVTGVESVCRGSNWFCKNYAYAFEVRAHLQRLEDDRETNIVPVELSELYLKRAGAVAEQHDLPPKDESTTELRILLEFGFITGETQWDENVIPPGRSYRNFGLPKWKHRRVKQLAWSVGSLRYRNRRITSGVANTAGCELIKPSA